MQPTAVAWCVRVIRRSSRGVCGSFDDRRLYGRRSSYQRKSHGVCLALRSFLFCIICRTGCCGGGCHVIGGLPHVLIYLVCLMWDLQDSLCTIHLYIYIYIYIYIIIIQLYFRSQWVHRKDNTKDAEQYIYILYIYI